MKNEKSNSSLFSFTKPTSIDESIDAINEYGVTFYVIGFLSIILYTFLEIPENTIDGALFVICGYMLRQYHSRTGAVIAILLSIGAVAATIYNHFGGVGGRNILLAIIVLVVSFKSCQATFAYHRLIGSRIIVKNFILKNIAAIIYSLLFTSLVIILNYLSSEYILSDKMLWFVIMTTLIISMFVSYSGWLPFTKQKICLINGNNNKNLSSNIEDIQKRHNTKTSAKEKTKALIDPLIIVLLVITMGIVFVYSVNKENTRSFSELVQQEVDATNKETPIKVDEDFEITKISFANNTITYHSKFVSLNKSEVSSELYQGKFDEDFHKDICSDIDLKKYIQHGISISYEFVDVNGEFIYKIITKPDNCKSLNN